MLQVQFDLGFLGVEKDYPEQKSSLHIKKERSCELTVQQKDKQKSLKRRIVIEHHHLQDKEVQDNERYIQKQDKKV